MKVVKKLNVYLLFLIALMLSFTSMNEARAAENYTVTIKDGSINFQTISTKASTNTRYKTVGFTITREARCDSTSSNANCAPQTGKYGAVKNKQVAEEDYSSDQVITYFMVDQDKVEDALKAADSLEIKDGDTIYLSAIFHVLHGNTEDQTDYTSLRSIRNAEAWADPNGFRQYYDIPVQYHSGGNPVDYILKTSDGKQLATDMIANASHPDGKWKLGEAITHELPPIFESAGVTYTLHKSYIQSKLDETKTNFVQEGDPSSNNALTKRNFTTYIGGTHLIGVYSEGNPVKAKFFATDGTELKDPEDLGEKKTGEEVSYTFPEKLDKDGEEFTIVQSYLVYNKEPDDKKFVQETGSSALLKRNMTTPAGGGSLIGVYKSALCEEGDPECDKEPDTPMGICKYIIVPPQLASNVETTFMDAAAQGHILGDDATNGRHFEATKGIPTSENLYANTWAYNYLFNHNFDNMQGTIKYDCEMNVTYKLRWTRKRDDKTMTASESKSYSFSFSRPYSYWDIEKLEVLSIDRAEMSNYALPGGTITLSPSGYLPPKVEKKNSKVVEDHVKPANTKKFSFNPPVVRGGNSRPKPPNDRDKLKNMAESNTDDPDVRNDTLKFTWVDTTTLVMDGEWYKNEGPTPKAIPAAPKLKSFKDAKDKTLFKDGLLIPKTLVNKANTPSTGYIYYLLLPENVNGISDMRYPINNINVVTVHTPVVDYSSISDDQEHNQKTVPNKNRSALILERPFIVRIPTTGQHLDSNSYPGYGDRDYAKYFRTKQVRFPFDVYNGNKTQFIPKDTWIDVPVNQLDTTFFLPVWVDEGDYQVYFRNIAENAPTGFTTQPDANTNLVNHVATDEISVEVIGRLYDFHITDIADFNWESVFRTSKGSTDPTGLTYWTGLNGIDGDARGNTEPFTLPIRQGSHPQEGFKNAAVKLGYHFKFDMKTKGNMFGSLDGIRITPDFYYQSKNGKESMPVDLYYRKDQNFIKVGSSADKVKRYVILNDRLRNVPQEDMTDTAKFKYDTYYSPEQLINISLEQYTNNYFNNASKEKVPVGNLSLLMLPEQLRTLIGPKVGIPETATASIERANASIQRWYGDYSLPAETYIVKAGTNVAEYARTHGGLDEDSSIFLKDGFVVVNFDIESIQKGKVDEPHLQYIHAPLMNQWKLEGFKNTIYDAYNNKFNLFDGDVVFYNADQSSKDDYSAQAPH